MAKAAAGGGGSADGDELSRATAAGIVAVAERCLAAEAHWLDAALSRGLLSDLSSSDMGDQLSFKSALARLANDLGCHRAEAARPSGAGATWMKRSLYTQTSLSHRTQT